MLDLIIRGGQVVTPMGVGEWDVAVQGERIAAAAGALGDEAGLFQAGIERGMVSAYQSNGLPKYVWAVDSYGQAYESKLSKGTSDYHGYRLSEFQDRYMRSQVINEWGSRSQVWRSN